MTDDSLRTVPRLIADAERRRLKAITGQALACLGGAESFVPSTRVEKAALSKYGSQSFPDHFIPTDIAVELDRAAQSPIVTGAMARLLNYKLVPIDAEPDAWLDIGDAIEIQKETGDVVNLLLALLARGGRLDAADRHDVLKEVTEAKAALYRLVAKLSGGAA